MDFNEYEKVIIRDVAGKNSRRDKRLLKICFGVISAIFILIYFFGFHSDILKNLKFILTSYHESVVTFDYDMKMLIYNFSRLIGFLLFMFLFIVFALFAFFAYDITARNKIIGYYKKKSEGDDAVETKEKDA